MSESVEGQRGGRGRGRARTSEQAQGVPLPPGASAPMIAERIPSEGIGRRALGRRAEPAAPVSPDGGEKPQRGSPADTGSPNETDKMAALELVSLATRPGYGQVGRKYRMFANHFELGFKTKVMTVNRYHIEITHPKVKLTRDDNRPVFWNCLMNNREALGIPNTDELHKVAFDGVANCFTVNPFTMPPENLFRFEVDMIVSKCDRPMKIAVLIQSVGPQIVDLAQATFTSSSSSQKILTPVQIIDIIIRQYRSNPLLDAVKTFYPFRNSIFMIPGLGHAPGGLNLGGGREVWKGLFTSAHVAENYQALVNMDVDHSCFYKHGSNGDGDGNGHYTAIMFLCDVLNEAEGRQVYIPNQIGAQTRLGDNQQRMFEREIKGLRVCKDYLPANSINQNREYRVVGVDKSSADITFQTREGGTMSVAEYWEKEYTQRYGPLKYPKMPTLKVGSKTKPMHLPIERCYLSPNQKVTKKLTENQTATMIRQTCMSPADRKRSIEQMVNFAHFGEDPFLKNFGIELSTQMVGIEGRILPPPAIGYGRNQTTQLRDGVWRASGSKFYVPARAKGIAAVAFGNAPNGAQGFVTQLMQTCAQFGMEMPAANNVYFHLERDVTPKRVEIAFKNVQDSMQQAGAELSLVIVFLQQKGTPLYGDVKRYAEVTMGVMTQCVVAKTVGRPSPDTLQNIAFKINMKLGGVNCVLNIRDAAAKCIFAAPTLLLGIDLSHPGPLDKKSPSVASVVGSMDLTHMRYAASIRVQKQRRESLVYLSDSVSDRLMYFYKTTQTKPERIIVYRDGVSEGEFKTVIREELRGIREGCSKVDQNFKPKITFIVVQKRHHTRLFPADPNDGCGKHRNVHPGSVVDNRIVFHEDFVFYLCSHFGIQGTSRPTRYYVLHDENNFSADDLQLLTYYLAHCYSRCTRAVSLPAPVYYAHLACQRARDHLAALVGESLTDTTSTHSGEPGRSVSSIPEEDLVRAATVQESMHNVMYFT